MLLKTYRAPDLGAALKKARSELGPEALVLATHEKQGRFGLSVVEITVAAARPVAPAPPVAPPPPVASATSPASPSPAAPADSPRAANGVPRSRGLDRAVEALVRSGLSRDLATRFARIAGERLGGRADAGRLAEATAQSMQQLLRFVPLSAQARCLFVVGPPGAGKTTTVAKLAARAVVAGRRPVFLAQADCDRIGSFEQSEIYATHIGATAARIEGAEDLSLVLEQAGSLGKVLVDTPGIAASDHERILELQELRLHVPEAEVVVLLPSGLNRTEAARVLDRFRPLEPTCVGFSRVDDGAEPGALVTALAERSFPLSFFTNGDGVPDDLETASPHGLAALLLRDAQAPRPPETNP